MFSPTDVKLGLRMLRKYPGLTIAGGLALAIAIGLGAGWYDFSRDLLRPRLPLPDGHRIVQIEMSNSLISADEHRILHDFLAWRRDARSIEQLTAYRSVERTLTRDGARLGSIFGAETTASAFRVARVPPLLGRTLLDADEQRGAPAVVVLGYQAWQRWFGGRDDAVGKTVGLGDATATVVGVMPEGFALPVNHQLWVPLQLRPSGYAPLEGVPVRVFGLLAPGASLARANTEFEALTARTKVASPQTHTNLHASVLAYGGQSPGSPVLELAVTHLPILLVLIAACVTVGILVYARTATRDAEIATRYALGANRARILSQLFMEALVLSSVAAVVGLTGAHWALKLGRAAFYSGQSAGPPFWIGSGLKLTTVFYAAGLAVAGAAMLGVLPALKATGSRVQAQLRNLGSGGSTLRFGRVWSAAMIGQVALTVIVLPPAMGIATEGIRDRVLRERFPAEEYLAVRIELDRDAGLAEESDTAFAARRERAYTELEGRLAQEPGIAAVTFGDRLPGMEVAVRQTEVEFTAGAPPARTNEMWTAAIGPGYFDIFDRAVVAGRGFHTGDYAGTTGTVIVNEAFGRRRFMNGANPIGRRVRYLSPNGTTPGPWFEIVGVVQDFSMTPTDLGEAPYIYHPASAGTVAPLVMGVRVRGDRAAVAQRVRAVAGELGPEILIGDLRPLEDLARNADLGPLVAAGAVAGIVLLGLVLSAVSIYSLVSVSVARRMREIGLRSALGASSSRVLASIFSKAAWLVGSGIVVGNGVLMVGITLASGQFPIAFVTQALMITSGIMLTVGLLACIAPARRVLRINPTDALRQL